LPKRIVSERKVAANRANAQRSTGPRTVEGKAQSRHNATRHGLRGTLPPERGTVPAEGGSLPAERAAALVLVADDAFNRYAELSGAFVADLVPRGAAEQFLVERMARAAWRLRRSESVEAELLDAAEEARLRQAVRDANANFKCDLLCDEDYEEDSVAAERAEWAAEPTPLA